MAARKPNHPLQRYEKRAGVRLCYLQSATPRPTISPCGTANCYNSAPAVSCNVQSAHLGNYKEVRRFH
jgi:hypothetical protein